MKYWYKSNQYFCEEEIKMPKTCCKTYFFIWIIQLKGFNLHR